MTLTSSPSPTLKRYGSELEWSLGNEEATQGRHWRKGTEKGGAGACYATPLRSEKSRKTWRSYEYGRGECCSFFFFDPTRSSLFALFGFVRPACLGSWGCVLGSWRNLCRVLVIKPKILLNPVGV